MKRWTKVKKLGHQVLGVVMMTVLMIGMPQFTSSATGLITLDESGGGVEVEVLEATLVENPNLNSGISPYTMLTSCIITASGASDGMHIDISTAAVGTASVLGVKDVKIYKKTWYGSWTLVATSNGGEAKNCSSMGIVILYENAIKDATYKITCVHYGNVDGYIEDAHDSGAFKFTY